MLPIMGRVFAHLIFQEDFNMIRNFIGDKFYFKSQQPHTTGETTMSKQQEHEIYCRLAKEIIESRLAVEPTQLRIHRLAKVIQTVDNEVYGC